MTPRLWLITGASSGFGLELAKTAAKHGDTVIATSRSPQKVEKFQGVTIVQLDHNQPFTDIENAVQDIVNTHGTPDIVVNNAGYVQSGTVEEASPEEMYKQFQANTLGPIQVYQAILPYLRERGSGTLITNGSMSAWYHMSGFNLYNASKAALRWLTLGMAHEIKGFGLKHCLIEAGYFRTELLKPGANVARTAPERRIPAYKDINDNADAILNEYNGTQAGDPVRGAEVMYEVITSTGRAKGRNLPAFLPLGSDACVEIGKTAQSTLDTIKEWAEIASQTDFPET